MIRRRAFEPSILWRKNIHHWHYPQRNLRFPYPIVKNEMGQGANEETNRDKTSRHSIWEPVLFPCYYSRRLCREVVMMDRARGYSVPIYNTKRAEEKASTETRIVLLAHIVPTLHGENFMAIFTTPSVVIWFSTGTLGIFATLVYVFTMPW